MHCLDFEPELHKSLLSDMDNSGTVDFADFLALSSVFGGDCDCSEDLDSDGNVGFSDFLILSGEFGKGIEFARPQIVPEPSAANAFVVMLILSTSCLRKGRTTPLQSSQPDPRC